MLFNRLKYSESGWTWENERALLDIRFLSTTTSFDLPRTTTSSVSKKFKGRLKISRHRGSRYAQKLVLVGANRDQ